MTLSSRALTLPEPTTWSYVTRWQADPVGIALVVLLAAGYLLLVRRAARLGVSWSRWRGASWLAALVATGYMTCGWVGVYARVLLWVFTLQVVLLLVVVPVFLSFGRPFTLARHACPGRVAAALTRVLRSRAGRVAASPATAPLVIPIVFALVFFTGILSPVLLHAWAARLLVVLLLGTGFVISLPFGGDDEDTSGLAIAAGIFLGFMEILLDAVPGIVVRLSTHPLALTAVTRRHQSWAPGALADQQYAGAVLWFLGEALDLPFLALLVYRWVRTDSAEAARIDAALDAAALTAPAVSAQPDDPPSRLGSAGEALPPGTARPWWETDPDRLGARRARAIREATSRREPG